MKHFNLKISYVGFDFIQSSLAPIPQLIISFFVLICSALSSRLRATSTDLNKENPESAIKQGSLHCKVTITDGKVSTILPNFGYKLVNVVLRIKNFKQDRLPKTNF